MLGGLSYCLCLGDDCYSLSSNIFARDPLSMDLRMQARRRKQN